MDWASRPDAGASEEGAKEARGKLHRQHIGHLIASILEEVSVLENLAHEEGAASLQHGVPDLVEVPAPRDGQSDRPDCETAPQRTKSLLWEPPDPDLSPSHEETTTQEEPEELAKNADDALFALSTVQALLHDREVMSENLRDYSAALSMVLAELGRLRAKAAQLGSARSQA
ncbi:unnamed protein product, partial [Polarella glacialis]